MSQPAGHVSATWCATVPPAPGPHWTGQRPTDGDQRLCRHWPRRLRHRCSIYAAGRYVNTYLLYTQTFVDHHRHRLRWPGLRGPTTRTRRSSRARARNCSESGGDPDAAQAGSGTHRSERLLVAPQVADRAADEQGCRRPAPRNRRRTPPAPRRRAQSATTLAPVRPRASQRQGARPPGRPPDPDEFHPVLDARPLAQQVVGEDLTGHPPHRNREVGARGTGRCGGLGVQHARSAARRARNRARRRWQTPTRCRR